MRGATCIMIHGGCVISFEKPGRLTLLALNAFVSADRRNLKQKATYEALSQERQWSSATTIFVRFREGLGLGIRE